jgi:hypothetical protein
MSSKKSAAEAGGDAAASGDVNSIHFWLSSEPDAWVKAATLASGALKTSKSNSDKPVYQENISFLEGHLKKLYPSSLDPHTISGTTIPKGSYNKFCFTTVSGGGGSCHAILVYVKTNDGSSEQSSSSSAASAASDSLVQPEPAQNMLSTPAPRQSRHSSPPRDSVKQEKTIYYYDPAGKEEAIPKFVLSDSVETPRINNDMCPYKGINPEGYCALWSIVVVILWDLNPELDFDGRMSILKRFNELIAGGKDEKGNNINKVPGLRKWFIATVYHLFMNITKRGCTAETAKIFIMRVNEHISRTLRINTSDKSSKPDGLLRIAEYVNKYNNIDKLLLSEQKTSQKAQKERITALRAHNNLLMDKAVDTYIQQIELKEDIKVTTDVDPGGAAAAAAAASPVVDLAAAVPGGVPVDTETDFGGGGLRRVRSLRHKNKMYRSKKVRKPRRTVKRRSRRSRRN